VLFLDDVGKEYRAASGWSDAELDNLMRTRTALGKVTMVSSNVKYADWEKYNSSMVSFLKEMGEIVILIAGSDHRDDEAPPARRRRAGR
jgi:DNA replication protein DnaC